MRTGSGVAIEMTTQVFPPSKGQTAMRADQVHCVERSVNMKVGGGRWRWEVLSLRRWKWEQSSLRRKLWDSQHFFMAAITEVLRRNASCLLHVWMAIEDLAYWTILLRSSFNAVIHRAWHRRTRLRNKLHCLGRTIWPGRGSDHYTIKAVICPTEQQLARCETSLLRLCFQVLQQRGTARRRQTSRYGCQKTIVCTTCQPPVLDPGSRHVLMATMPCFCSKARSSWNLGSKSKNGLNSYSFN